MFCLAEKAKIRRTNSRTNCQQNSKIVCPKYNAHPTAYATEWYSRYPRSSCVLGYFIFNEWKEGTPETWVHFIFSGRPWLHLLNSNKSNIYSEDLPIVMTNQMCFPHKSNDYVGYLIIRKPLHCRGTKTTAVLISSVLHRRSAMTMIVTIPRQIIIIFWIG